MIVLVDIDGTLAIRNGRGPFEWDLSFTDRPNKPVVEVIVGLVSLGHEVVYVSGRHESLRFSTSQWLVDNVSIDGRLLMRNDGDYRSDEIVKAELVKRNFDDLSEILLVIDDRERVVKMWREHLGLTCLQVADGSF